MLLARMLDRMIRVGRLTLVDAGGRTHRFGRQDGGGDSGLVLRLHDPRLHWKLVTVPRLHLGEAYMDGTLSIEGGSLYDLLDLLGRNMENLSSQWGDRLTRGIDRIGERARQINGIARSRRNVAHHYDLSARLYDLFLDRDRQYSCAYFERPDASLEEAQEAKKRHLAAKLLLKPGQRVLDIGSGWGGLALYLARVADVEVDGITLSTEQLEVARRRAAEAGLADRVRFHLRDYRHQTGRYDRIVSVGMFEHVGVPNYGTFFAKVRDLLADDGIAVLHSIGHRGPPGPSSPWIRKYIFPGGYIPALSEVTPAVERTGLWITDLEILRLHYAETLRHWRERFLANRDEVAAIYDERFCRMWEFYLAGSEISFRYMGNMVFQAQLARRQDAVPLTRDYLAEEERRLARRERVEAA